MVGIKDKEKEEIRDGAAFDTNREIQFLRREVEKTRSIFDSARMIVSHELNKPLTSIRGYVELIEERFENESGQKEKRYFSKIRQAVLELERMIESSVDMLRYDQYGEQVDDFDEIDIYLLVEKYREKYDGFRVGIENAVDREMDPVLVRKSCLEIVLDNLITNAMKHGGGSAPVRIEASIQKERRGLSRGRILIIKVEDGGKGIAKKDIEEIFDPFYRGEAGEEIDGLGLGLALVRNVTNIMMGNVSIKSEPGKGTVATVCIPLPEEGLDPSEKIGQRANDVNH